MLSKITHIKLAVCIKAYGYIYTVHFCIFQLHITYVKRQTHIKSYNLFTANQMYVNRNSNFNKNKIIQSNVRNLKD